MAHSSAECLSGAISVSSMGPVDARERLAPARGILLGLALSSSFWAGLAVWALA